MGRALKYGITRGTTSTGRQPDYLSAATQIDLDYAQDVVRNVVSEPLKARAPAYGVDIAVPGAMGCGFDHASRPPRYASRHHSVLPSSYSFRKRPIWLPAALIVIFAGLVAGWVIVSLEYWTRDCTRLSLENSAGNLISRRPRFPVMHGSSRIDMVSDRRRGNLAIFHGESAFVGSGQRLSKEHIVIDVSRGRKVKNGKPQKPRKFGNADVHDAMIQTMKKLGFAEMRVEEKLFVNGRHIKGNPHSFLRATPPPRLLRGPGSA